MDVCAKCGMPIDDSTRCSCTPSVCFHCCTCDPDCVCGCSDMTDDLPPEEEEME